MVAAVSVPARRARILLAVLTLVLIGAAPRALSAQTPAEAPQTAPAPHWTGQIMGSPLYMFKFGPNDTTMVSFNGALELVKPNVSYSFDGDYTHMTLTPKGSSSVTLTDAQHLNFTLARDLTSRTYLALRSGFKRDKQQSIDYQFEELAGFGIILAQHARGTLHVVPLAGVIRQEKNIAAVDGTSGTGGVLQLSSFQLNPMWRWEESLLFMQNFKDSEDQRLQFSAGLTGVISGPFSMQLSYSTERDNLILDSTNKAVHQLTFSVGLTFQ